MTEAEYEAAYAEVYGGDEEGHYDGDPVPGAQLHPDDLARLRERIGRYEPCGSQHTGQLIGGPDNGNVVAGGDLIRCCFDTFRWLDGPDHPVHGHRVTGHYLWSHLDGFWVWQGDTSYTLGNPS